MDISRQLKDLKELRELEARADEMPNSLKISELSAKTSIDSGDLMLVSNPLQQNVWRSYRMPYDELSSNIKTIVSSLPDTTLKGDWQIISSSLAGHGRFTIPTKRIDEENKYSVVNCDWLSTRFIRKLRELSSEIYDKDHLQSYVGEVIYTTTLKTEEQVRKRYGAYTSWERIEGRFIMSTVAGGMLMQTTGDYKSPLSLADTPKHMHRLEFVDNKKTYRLNWTLSPSVTNICHPDESSHGEDKGEKSDAWTMLILYPMKDAVEYTKYGASKSFASGRVIVAYGRGPSHGEGGAKILPNKGENVPHNNIPPFYTVHVWRRVR